jgi:hypothetical protein
MGCCSQHRSINRRRITGVKQRPMLASLTIEAAKRTPTVATYRLRRRTIGRPLLRETDEPCRLAVHRRPLLYTMTLNLWLAGRLSD